MKYSVSYKLAGISRTRTIKNVVCDGFVPESTYPTRFFLLETNERIEVPAAGTVFTFSADRFNLIHQRMQEQAGQAIPIRKS